MTDGTSRGHVVDWLDAWRTGELDEPRAREVEAHLESCAGCRAELAELEAFARTVEAGYRGAEAAREEPDWGASRAAIVARTSAAADGSGRSWFARWAPQAAIVLVAVVAIGVLVEEGVRGPDDVPRSLREPVEETGAAADARESAGARSASSEETGRPAELVAPEAAPPPADRDGDAGVDDEAAGRDPAPPHEKARAADRVEGKAALEEPAAPQARAEAERADEARAPANLERDRPALAQESLPAPERFRRDARAALASGDTLAARNALEFLADSVEPAALENAQRERLRALADSLATLLSGVP